ncbi:MAG TPA: hypothetical protein DCP67_10310 [Planctomycetaceae bacterium]|nr:hypothetical protein [Planctomycetaceae bacterium]HCK72642.1 hypothetical protein [Planctomycetaceae bacterium]HCP85490.1 hypothetical protein [Planctomycetaceae bacterium]
MADSHRRLGRRIETDAYFGALLVRTATYGIDSSLGNGLPGQAHALCMQSPSNTARSRVFEIGMDAGQWYGMSSYL